MQYRYLKEEVARGVFKEWQEVDIVVYAFTDLGVKVAINDTYGGLVYKNEIFTQLYDGQRLKGFIKCIREDGKIDISLQPEEGKHVLATTEKIINLLKKSDGRLSLNDKSSPDDIKKHLQISKKVFKKAIGVLYKQRKVKITSTGIELIT